FFKQMTAYEIETCLEFRRLLFRSGRCRFSYLSSYIAQQLARLPSPSYDKSTSALDEGGPTNYGLCGQRRHTPMKGHVSFISYGRNDRLSTPLSAAKSIHPRCVGAVRTLLNGRCRFSYFVYTTTSISTRASFGRRLTSTHARAGYGCCK